ncbi:peptide ABC transporter permease [Sphingomonas cannabina]|uniref:peptide ABC transporter permease n=1 Tax=Sphingomonas cannabina TaxID=2899123 RepID=UPI001F1BF377|nr:peptide ABC transporter permease [Sphingomonas cannabina]UIJ44355.1 peptide ABC transporter permease [Sphingomonas cannabina]
MPTEPEEKPVHISAEDARGGEIILRSRARRAVFLAGLVGMVVLAILLVLAGVAHWRG